MQFFVAVTDNEWFRFLSRVPYLDEINFWRPRSTRPPKHLDDGELFLFKLHWPENFVVGGGWYATFSALPASLAWDAFGVKNGAASYEAMLERIGKYRSSEQGGIPDPAIGCVILSQPFFFEREDWIPAPPDFKKPTQTGKTYTLEMETGRELWEAGVVPASVERKMTVIQGPMARSGYRSFRRRRTTVMAKHGRKAAKGKAARAGQGVAQQRLLQLVEVLVNAREGLRELVIGSGLQVLMAMLEEDREELCGPARKKQPDRRAYRYGHDRGQLVMGGRKISVPKPRVRSLEGHELQLPSWEAFSTEDPLQDRVVEQVLVGVSTRGYERSLEPLPAELESIAIKKSSVSRRFVARTQRQVQEFLSRPLDDVDLPILMIDGTELGERLLVMALGIDWNGHKHLLGVWEGVTESYEVGRSFLRDLIDRGLPVERARLFVIDGSKGLRKAIRQCFGQWALIHRCHVHKLRNVLEHLPGHKRPWVRAKMNRAWYKGNTPDVARTQLEQLATSLESDHPGAAASLREGLEETLTLVRLGADGALYKALRSTNPIENVMGTVKRVSRNVKRWRSGSMVVRWAVTGLLEAESRFRRVNGYRDLPLLLAELDRLVRKEASQDARKIA